MGLGYTILDPNVSCLAKLCGFSLCCYLTNLPENGVECRGHGAVLADPAAFSGAQHMRPQQNLREKRDHGKNICIGYQCPFA